MTNNQPFLNSGTQLYLSDGSATPTLILIPTTSLSAPSQTRRETWFSTADVDTAGTAHENGVVTGQSKTIKVVTKQFHDGDEVTPAILDALETLLDCEDASGMDVRFDFVLRQANGKATIAAYDVCNVNPVEGGTEASAALTCDLVRAGKPTAYAGTFPE